MQNISAKILRSYFISFPYRKRDMLHTLIPNIKYEDSSDI